MANIENNHTILTITRDGEDVTEEYAPSRWEQAGEIVKDGLVRALDNVKLEARMIAFDAIHRTHYRRIRHQLLEEQKRMAFAEEIGLLALVK